MEHLYSRVSEATNLSELDDIESQIKVILALISTKRSELRAGTKGPLLPQFSRHPRAFALAFNKNKSETLVDELLSELATTDMTAPNNTSLLANVFYLVLLFKSEKDSRKIIKEQLLNRYFDVNFNDVTRKILDVYGRFKSAKEHPEEEELYIEGYKIVLHNYVYSFNGTEYLIPLQKHSRVTTETYADLVAEMLKQHSTNNTNLKYLFRDHLSQFLDLIFNQVEPTTKQKKLLAEYVSTMGMPLTDLKSRGYTRVTDTELHCYLISITTGKEKEYLESIKRCL